MLDDLPPFLTVEQAAKVLQLGRSKTYELTVEFDCSAGRTGLPFVWLGWTEAHPAHCADPLHGPRLPTISCSVIER